MNRPAKPAPVQFYLDADVLGLAKILIQIRGDVTYPGDPGGKVKGGRVRAACPVTDAATPDRVWIPETARQGWLIITRDRHIQEHRAEIAAVKSSWRPHGHPGRSRGREHVQPARSSHVQLAPGPAAA